MTPAFAPHAVDRKSAFARNLIGAGGIVACREAPTYVADQRSLKAGLAIYGAVALVLGIIVLIAWGYLGAGKP